jgi:hypothetical protein
MMRFRRLALPMLVLCLMTAALSSCLSRRRLIPRASTTKTLQKATLPTLLAAIARQYEAVHDFKGTVEMVPARGSAENNDIKEYKIVDRAYIRFRKDADIRLIGLTAVVRTTAFDMTSNGADFKLYIPYKNLFLTGSNAIQELSADKLENLRPQHFVDALLVRPIDTKNNKYFMWDFTDEDNAYYIINEVHETADGRIQPKRTIWISRLDLTIARQMIFDDDGGLLTDARYSQWRPYDNVPFPKHIEINRPRDEYAVVFDVDKLEINKGIADSEFVLEQPEGTTLRVVGQAPDKGPQK